MASSSAQYVDQQLRCGFRDDWLIGVVGSACDPHVQLQDLLDIVEADGLFDPGKQIQRCDFCAAAASAVVASTPARPSRTSPFGVREICPDM